MPAPKPIYLTFDDGPHPVHTKSILDTLKAEGVPATFFVVGRRVAEHGPALLERAVAEGHAIANHSYTHPKLTTLTPQAVADEISKTHALIERFQKGRKLFRPPYGDHDPAVDAAVAAAGYKLVMWTADTADWDKRNQPDGWVRRGVEQARAADRAVVLCHDIQPTTAAHLRKFVRELRELGPVEFRTGATL